jgi:hypothetical protein
VIAYHHEQHVTNYMEQSPSDGGSHSTGKFLAFDEIRMFITRVHKSPPLDPILSQGNLAHTLTTYLFNKMTVFWDIAPCSLVKVDRRFRGVYCLHHQGGLKGCHIHTRRRKDLKFKPCRYDQAASTSCSEDHDLSQNLGTSLKLHYM